MSVKPIVIIGEPKLLQKSKPVKLSQIAELGQLFVDLEDTQKHLDGAGIAAPQIGVNLRVIRFGFDFCARYPEREPVAETILINPEFEALSDEKILTWEGCLSVPGVRAEVLRYTHIRYWGVDERGQKIEREVSGFHAFAIQHETDHLDGILFVHRNKILKTIVPPVAQRDFVPRP